MPQRDARTSRVRSATATAPGRPAGRRRTDAEDRFFRHLVSSMRNGVIAIRRDGTLALMNDEAYRIFALTREARDAGRPFAEVLRTRPDVVRVLGGAFELTNLTDVLHQAVTLAETKAKRGNVSVDIDVPGDVPMLEGVHHQLCQVFTNLIANAFEALGGKGRIAIGAALRPGEPNPVLT